jgi:predicted nucleic acid-binding protein
MLVDTSVLMDVLENDPEWADWSIAQLQAQSRVLRLMINSIIYGKLALILSTVKAFTAAVDGIALNFLKIPKPALFLASKAFVEYRRRGGAKK